MSVHFQNFSFFPITSCIINDCFASMDTGKPMVHSDAQANQACCRDCQWVCCPLTLAFDIISFPFRGIYSCAKCSSEKYTECKQGKRCVCAKNTIEPECSTHTKAISSQPIKDLDKNNINIAPK